MSATASLASFRIAFTGLVLDAAGDYTARSVASDPLDASALHLVRQPDGAYAVPAADPFVVSSEAAARSSAAVRGVLQGLALGG